MQVSIIEFRNTYTTTWNNITGIYDVQITSGGFRVKRHKKKKRKKISQKECEIVTHNAAIESFIKNLRLIIQKCNLI